MSVLQIRGLSGYRLASFVALRTLKNGFPCKRKHAAWIEGEEIEPFAWVAESLLTHCYSVWTPPKVTLVCFLSTIGLWPACRRAAHVMVVWGASRTIGVVQATSSSCVKSLFIGRIMRYGSLVGGNIRQLPFLIARTISSLIYKYG